MSGDYIMEWNIRITLFFLMTSGTLITAEEDFLFQNKKKYIVEEVEGVTGQAARIPCNMTVLSGDTVYLVLWFKEGLTTPIYSYDVRELLGGQPKHWWDAELLESRAYFNAGSDPSHLLLQGLTQEDAGLYKCRVDFQREPTRNTRINLTVVEPPRRLLLIDDTGVEVRTYLGPVNEGSDLTIICEAHGGNPKPSVTWYLNGQVLDDAIEGYEGDITQNVLTIRDVTRSMLRSELTCRASNNKVSQPLTATATIDMNLRPLDVSIHHTREPLSSGHSYEIMCSSRGSRPPAVLTWWTGSTRLPTFSDTTTNDGNVSTSVVKLKPNSSDDGKLLSCRAENRNIPTAVIEDTWKLTIYYAPAARAYLGTSLNPNNIREGDDVYFECQVKANPRAYKVVWKHNGVLVRQEKEGGVILTNRSLVVQEVTREQAGQYSCMASNVEGDSTSTPVTLSVQFTPVCQPGQVEIYGVSKLEDAQVTCQVDAVPQVTKFYWSFNNTAETLEVPQARFTVGLGGRSVVIYTPMSDLDYGTLLCRAENLVGRQTEPCVFHIIPATQPEAPTNCTVVNVSASSLMVVCTAGFDGGLNQSFAMEVYARNPHALKANITNSKTPKFVVKDLENDSQFQLIVYSGNAKGRSSITRLVALTQKLPVKQLETRLSSGKGATSASQEDKGFEITPLLGILAGMILVLLFVAIIIIVILKAKHNRRARPPQCQQHQEHNVNSNKSNHQKSQDPSKQKNISLDAAAHRHNIIEAQNVPCDHSDRFNRDHQGIHHIEDQSPDVIACSGEDCEEVSVSIRSGGLLSTQADHRQKPHHLQHGHQPLPSLLQHPVQCQKQNFHQQHHHIQHYHQPHPSSQHSQDSNFYTMPLPDHLYHNSRHSGQLHRHHEYGTTPRLSNNEDIEIHLGERMTDSGTPPTPAPDDTGVTLLCLSDNVQQQQQQQQNFDKSKGHLSGSLARIPEDPESPTSGRRESAV